MFSNLNHSAVTVNERLPTLSDTFVEEDEKAAKCIGGQSASNDVGTSCMKDLQDTTHVEIQPALMNTSSSGELIFNDKNRNVNEMQAAPSGISINGETIGNHVASIEDGLQVEVGLLVEDETTRQPRRQSLPLSFNENPELTTMTSAISSLRNVPGKTSKMPVSKPSEQTENCRKTSTTSGASSVGSLDEESTASSVPDFRILKSAMKRSCEDERTGKRKLSLFNTVMRRVSIHRRESTPTGRIGMFLFGVDDVNDATKEEEEGDRQANEKSALRDSCNVEEHGGHKVRGGRDKKKLQAAKLKEGLFQMLSGLYGIIIVILGAVLPITEIFMGDDLDRTFQAFYIYLYVVSIVFLVYVYAYLLRRNQLKTEFLTRTLSRSLSWTRAWSKSMAKGTEPDVKGKRKRMISLDSNHHTGTFYLRLGVLGFGIGSMIHSGLNFGAYVSASSACTEAIQAIKPVIHLIFTFFQLYFIFMNSKMCIHRYKKLARFGLMHMCATNICVWFHSIVVETMHVIHLQAHGGGHNGADKEHHNAKGSAGHGDNHAGAGHHGGYNNRKEGSNHENPVYSLINATVSSGRKLHAAAPMISLGNGSIPDDSCQWVDLMGKAVEASGTYLYPCTIEYSLMCAGILYVAWTNVGTKPRLPRNSKHDSDDEDGNMHRMSVDCTSSSRGLFLGILLMVGTIISIIAFYMLNHREDMKSSGIILAHLSETAIYTVTFVALFLAAYRMKDLTFHADHEVDLEDILVLISFTGLLAFIIFSIVASVLSEPSIQSGLTILSNLLMLFQSTTQTLFMLAGDRMTASTEEQARKKPGREFITFLLISNFAMWALNTFETQTPQHNPVQMEFYGATAWAIFTHISVPLGIYYRFHSTVCFSNIWKNAWKRKSH